MRRFVLAASLALLASACASVPMAPPEADRAAKAFKAPADRANLYVFRDESLGAAMKLDMLLDGVPLGQTAAHTFLFCELAPGKHTLVSRAENEDLLAIEAKPGTNVFVWQEVKMGILSARSKLSLVDEASGKARVTTCNLAQTIQPKLPGPQQLAPPQS